LAACASAPLQITLQRFDLVKFLELNQEYEFGMHVVVHCAAGRRRARQAPDCRQLQAASCSSSSLAPRRSAPSCRRRWRSGSAPPCLQGYGMSELSPVSHLVPVGARRPGSAGKTVANTEIKLVDPEGKPVAKGVNRASSWCAARRSCKGYLNNPAATAVTIDADGFLHTGDVATIDDDGFIVIVDRIKELIKVAGFQVAPAELESLLLAHPNIADVAVIGIRGRPVGRGAKGVCGQEGRRGGAGDQGLVQAAGGDVQAAARGAVCRQRFQRARRARFCDVCCEKWKQQQQQQQQSKVDRLLQLCRDFNFTDEFHCSRCRCDRDADHCGACSTGHHAVECVEGVASSAQLRDKNLFHSHSLTDACAVECSTSACNSIQSSNSCNGNQFFCSGSNLIQLWVARGFCSLFVFRLLTIRICRDLRQESLSGSVSSAVGLLTSLRYL
jgi:acyl-CoA synthetase (AMP-forming)/AMP-acid ligase II